MFLYNYIVLIVLTALALLTGLIKTKRTFLITNFIVVSLLVINYSIILYLAYTYAIDNLNHHGFEALKYSARVIFNDLIFNFIGVLIFLVLNTLLIYKKFWKH